MNFIIIPSMESIALTKVAALLWNEHDIRTLVEEFINSPFFLHVDDELNILPPTPRRKRDRWQKVVEKVLKKSSLYTISICLKEKLPIYIQSIGKEILKWLEYHCCSCGLVDLGLPKEIFWTPQGTIDKKKTAQVLVKDASIGITTRFKLACTYCLEDVIPELWNKIPENDKKSFYSADPGKALQKELVDIWTYFIKGDMGKTFYSEDPAKALQKELVGIWTYIIKGEMSKIDDMVRKDLNYPGDYPYDYPSYTCALSLAARSGNKAATEYFFKKLTKKVNTQFVIVTAIIAVRTCYDSYSVFTDPPKEYNSEVLCFLLSQMNNEEQVEFFEKHYSNVLECLVDWPYQVLYIETAKHLWKFFPESYYIINPIILIFKIIVGYKDYDYQKLFMDYWHEMPNVQKTHIINNPDIAGLISNLVWVKDKEFCKESIKMIFQDATLAERKKVLFGEDGEHICKKLLLLDEWDILKYFVHVCISSKEEMMEFAHHRKSLKPGENDDEGSDEDCDEIKEKSTLFVQRIDEYIAEYDERENVKE